jgi:type II secretory pathway predicted ATPase ExeA
MYERHFGLERRPFRTSADADCYYPATTHEQALAQLTQGLAGDEGLVLLTGGPGMGKTLLCHRLLADLGADRVSSFLTNSHFPGCAGLLQALLYDLSLPYEGRGEQELRLALTDWLLQNYGSGRRAVFVIDEAQNLRPEHLEELRLLSNLEAKDGRAVQVLLAAQPRFLDVLKRTELAGFRQRLTVQVELQALELHEAVDYLVHHLRWAGGEGIMSDEALEVLARGSGGVPRLLNQAAPQAMLLAFTAGASQVDAEAAHEALAILGLDLATGTEAPCLLPVVASAAGDAETTDETAEEPGEETTLKDIRADGPEDVGRSSRLYGQTRRPA